MKSDFNRFLEFYGECYEQIYNACRDGFHLYDFLDVVNWHEHMSPIERILWDILRTSRIPFYPQYPVAGRFVDFGNPYHKIAIEADGAQFHDEESDAQRDGELSLAGWKVYHVSGRELYRQCPDWESLHDSHEDNVEQECYDWIVSTAEGLEMALSWYYGYSSIGACPASDWLPDEKISEFLHICLDRHARIVHDRREF